MNFGLTASVASIKGLSGIPKPFSITFRLQVKRRHGVPEIRLAATDAGMPGLHWKAGSVIELDGRAVVAGLFTLASSFEQAAGLVLAVWALAVDFFPYATWAGHHHPAPHLPERR
jgi:hypothetical protein